MGNLFIVTSLDGSGFESIMMEWYLEQRSCIIGYMTQMEILRLAQLLHRAFPILHKNTFIKVLTQVHYWGGETIVVALGVKAGIALKYGMRTYA